MLSRIIKRHWERSVFVLIPATGTFLRATRLPDSKNE
jgi:hypothetical protein